MNNNPNKLVSIKSAVVDLIEDTGTEEYLQLLPTLIKWGLKADQKIGSFYQYKKSVKVLEVQDCKIQIPCQAVMITGIALGDYGCDCGFFFDQVWNNVTTIADAFNTGLLFSFSDNTISSAQVDWEIQGNNIVFPYGYTDGEKMTVMFLEYEVDGEQFPLVHYCNTEAITAFIKWKLVKQKVHKTFLGNKNYYPDAAYEVRCRKDWNLACSNARAILGSPTNSQMNEIAEILNNPMSGRGNILLEKLY